MIKRIKAEMKSQNVSQAQLVRTTGLTKSAISQYLSGKRKMTENAQALICDALNITSETVEDVPKRTKLSIDMIAMLMGKSPVFVREGLKQGTLTFGAAVKMPSGKYSFYISPKKFTEVTGIEVNVNG